MSVLDLKLADYSDGASVPNKPFQVLRTYLEPWNSTSMDEAAAEIIDLLPDDDPRESAMYEFGGICCEIGEQIPYNHPSHYKFAALLHRLGKSTKLCPTSTEGKHTFYSMFPRFGQALLDNLTEPEPERPHEYVNFHAFVANLDGHHIYSSEPSWAIWQHREAFEEDKEAGPIRDTHIMAAAQYLLYNGQDLYRQIKTPKEMGLQEQVRWKPGPLYSGKAALSLRRWRFWKDGYERVSQNSDEEKGYSQECKDIARIVARLMGCFEDALPLA